MIIRLAFPNEIKDIMAIMAESKIFYQKMVAINGKMVILLKKLLLRIS